jgi:hypothetical protein
MALTSHAKATPTSINYASLTSYLSLPSISNDTSSPLSTSPQTTASSLLVDRPNNRQTEGDFPPQSAATPADLDRPSFTSGHDLERQRHLRQNQEIIRLCSLKSIQIRQSEARLSQLESENISLRATMNRMRHELRRKSSSSTRKCHRLPTLTSPHNKDRDHYNRLHSYYRKGLVVDQGCTVQ